MICKADQICANFDNWLILRKKNIFGINNCKLKYLARCRRGLAIHLEEPYSSPVSNEQKSTYHPIILNTEAILHQNGGIAV